MARKRPAYFILDDGFLFFECVTDLTADESSTATDHPVEDGPNITDHIRPDPDRVQLDVMVSNLPTDTGDPNGIARLYGVPLEPQTVDLSDEADALGRRQREALRGADAAVQVFPDGPPNVVADLKARLQTLRTTGARMDVVMRSGVYRSMRIEKITEKRTPALGDSSTLSIALKKIRVVTLQTVANPRPKEPRGQLKIDNGQQQPTPVEDGALKSGAAELVDQFTAAIGL